jgi:hypothetical protein
VDDAVDEEVRVLEGVVDPDMVLLPVLVLLMVNDGVPELLAVFVPVAVLDIVLVPLLVKEAVLETLLVNEAVADTVGVGVVDPVELAVPVWLGVHEPLEEEVIVGDEVIVLEAVSEKVLLPLLVIVMLGDEVADGDEVLESDGCEITSLINR